MRKYRGWTDEVFSLGELHTFLRSMTMITMSYTDESGVDGTGAQVYRYAVSCGLAQKFGVKWRHVPIAKIESNPLDTFASPCEKYLFLERLNYFIKPKDSSVKNPWFQLIIRRTLSPRQLKILLHIAGRMKSSLNLLDISLFRPQTYAFYFENVLEDYFGGIGSRLESHHSEKNIKLTVAHIRGALKTDRRTDRRVLYSMLQSIQATLDEFHLNSRFLVITDMPKNQIAWNVDPDREPGTLDYWISQGILDNQDTISLDYFDFEGEFTSIRNLEVIRHIDPLEFWRIASKADIFIGCDSSLSIIGGYLNESLKRVAMVFPSKIELSIPGRWLKYENSVQALKKNESIIPKMVKDLLIDD